MVKNYMEILVYEVLNEILEKELKYKDICKCDICMDDIVAKTLNNVPPFYVTCKYGEVIGEYNNLGFQKKTDIFIQIIKSIECISKNLHKN